MMIRLLLPSIPSLPQVAPGSAANSIQVAAEVSTIVVAVLAVLVLIVAIPLVLQLKKLVVVLQNHVQPVTDRARVAAENVEYISAVVREDVLKVRTSVSGLSDRLKDASDRMEERVEEFNALMDVVQDEAEAVLLDTAAVVRGVRAGAQTMGEGVTVAQPPGESSPGGTPPEDLRKTTPPHGDPIDGEHDPDAEDSGGGEAMAREAPEGR